MKIAVIGGGSTYTPELVEGFGLRSGRLPVDELVLHDIDPDRLEVVGRLNRDVIAMLTDLLEAVPVPAAAARAEAVFSMLLGLVVRQSVRRRPFDEIRAELEFVAGGGRLSSAPPGR